MCCCVSEVRLLDSVSSGTNIRPIGCDIAEGELVTATTHTSTHSHSLLSVHASHTTALV